MADGNPENLILVSQNGFFDGRKKIQKLFRNIEKKYEDKVIVLKIEKK